MWDEFFCDCKKVGPMEKVMFLAEKLMFLFFKFVILSFLCLEFVKDFVYFQLRNCDKGNFMIV